MPDLLAHVFLAYGICSLLALRFDWVTPEYRTVGMLGALLPDVYKVYLLVPNAVVESLLGVPFNWFALRTGGGVAITVVMATMVFVPRHRLRSGALLAVGASSHLVADLFLTTPTGHAFPILWPLTGWRPLTPNLYRSTDPVVTLAFATFALAAFMAVRITGNGSTTA